MDALDVVIAVGTVGALTGFVFAVVDLVRGR